MDSPFVTAGLLLINVPAGLYLMAVILRFLLQVVKADFYNPVCQLVVKVTNKPLLPLRKIIPGFMGLDIAALVLALLVQIVAISLSIFVSGGNDYPFDLVFIWATLGLIGSFLKLYLWGTIIMSIASWVAPGNYNPALAVLQQILEPVYKPIRKLLPDMGGLDISPIFVILAIMIFNIFLLELLSVFGNSPGFIIGL